MLLRRAHCCFKLSFDAFFLLFICWEPTKSQCFALNNCMAMHVFLCPVPSRGIADLSRKLSESEKFGKTNVAIEWSYDY